MNRQTGQLEPDRTRPIVQNVAMKAVIAHDGKLLLMQESAAHAADGKPGRYQFPGGRVEPGEPFEDGLRREVMEEAGLEIEIGRPIFVGEWRPVIKGLPHQIIATFIICTPKTIDVRISDEHDGYEWLTLEQARRLDPMTPDNQVVEAYFTQHVSA